MVVGEPAGTIEAPGLLVRGHGQQDVAAQAGDRLRGRIAAGCSGLPGQQAEDLDLHRHEILHVDGAAPVDVPVDDGSAEWILRPLVGGCRDDIEV